MIIPGDGLPYSSSVSCLDFDDSHGILLIGSDAGQFCLVNFANVLLTSEAFVGGLPIVNPAGETNISKVYSSLFWRQAKTEVVLDSFGHGHPNLLLLLHTPRIHQGRTPCICSRRFYSSLGRCICQSRTNSRLVKRLVQVSFRQRMDPSPFTLGRTRFCAQSRAGRSSNTHSSPILWRDNANHI